MDAFEWSTLFLYLVAWWIPTIIGLYTSTMSMFSEKKSMKQRYEDFETFLPKIVPGWAFGPIWAVLYTLIGISSWMYLNWSDTELHDDYQGYYDAVHALLLGNYVLNVAWTSVFFGFSLYWLGTIMGFFIFASALVIAVLMWIHSGLSAITVLGAVFFIPYVFYSGYAFILALDISINYYGGKGRGKREEEEIEMEKIESRMPSGGSRRPKRRQPPTGNPKERVTRLYEYV